MGLVCLNLWVMKVSFIPTTIVLLRRAVGPYFLRRVCLHPRQCVHSACSACIARSHGNELYLLEAEAVGADDSGRHRAPWEARGARGGCGDRAQTTGSVVLF